MLGHAEQALPGAQEFHVSPAPSATAPPSDPTALTDIYREEINIAVWQRSLSPKLSEQVDGILEEERALAASLTLSPHKVAESISVTLRIPATSPLVEDIAELVDMFCCLFDRPRAGLRITALDHAMCPRFHVDKVVCRLITTYQGVATEWIPNASADRSHLGAGSQGKADHESGLYRRPRDIRRLSVGDVALLKGEGWIGNEGRGLIHRSPAVPEGGKRLVLTLDLVQ